MVIGLPVTCRQVVKFGTSSVVTLPPDWLRSYHLKVGDKVDVLYGTLLIVKPRDRGWDPDLVAKELAVLAKYNRVKGGNT